MPSTIRARVTVVMLPPNAMYIAELASRITFCVSAKSDSTTPTSAVKSRLSLSIAAMVARSESDSIGKSPRSFMRAHSLSSSAAFGRCSVYVVIRLMARCRPSGRFAQVKQTSLETLGEFVGW